MPQTTDRDQLSVRLREHLRRNGFKIGSKLPAERELAVALGVGRTAMRPVLDLLEQEGILERRPQAGTFLKSVPAPLIKGGRITVIAPFGQTTVKNGEWGSEWMYAVTGAFEKVVRATGVDLQLRDQLAEENNSADLSLQVKDALQEGAQAVVMVCPLGNQESLNRTLSTLYENGVHAIMSAPGPRRPMSSWVWFEESWGAYVLTRHLLDRGHSAIGFVGLSPKITSSSERLAGVEQALGMSGIGMQPDWLWEDPGLAELQMGYFAAEKWKEIDDGSKPTALVASTTNIALGLTARFKELKVTVPEDVSVVCFGDSLGIQLQYLTTMVQPSAELGAALAWVALEQMALGEPTSALSQMLRPTLIERKSVAVPKS